MSKLLPTFKKLQMQLEADWYEDLDNLNIWQEVQDLYFNLKDNRKANTILCFIAFAYDKDSDWLDMHQDRMENKCRIMRTLAGDNFQTDQDYVNATVGMMSPYNNVIEWYINYQMDWRFADVLAGFEFHSRAVSMSKMAFDNKEMAAAGRTLSQAKLIRKEADQLLDELKKEMMVLDASLTKEDRKKITDTDRGQKYEFGHEAWLKGRKAQEDDTFDDGGFSFEDEEF